jgi:hypothetical protein
MVWLHHMGDTLTRFIEISGFEESVFAQGLRVKRRHDHG